MTKHTKLPLRSMTKKQWEKQVSGQSYTFTNKNGHTMRLNAKLTIADLVKMGMDHIRIVPKTQPLKDGEWSHTPKKTEGKV